MPISNGTGSFSVGRDCQVVVTGPQGVIQIDNVTEFDLDPRFVDITVDCLDGTLLNASLPKGGSGHISFERANSAVDDYFASAEANWFGPGIYQASTLDQYITEVSGQSIYGITNVALKWKPGAWRADASIKAQIMFNYFRREKQ